MIVDAGIIGICVFGLFLIICAFIAIPANKTSVTLEDRLPNTESKDMMEDFLGISSNTKYGKFHKKYMAKMLAGEKKNKVAKILGIKPEQLEQDIYSARMENDITVDEFISMKILGYTGALLFALLFVVTGRNTAVLALAIVAYFLGVMMPTRKVYGKIAQRKDDMLLELPNFIELTYSIIEAGATVQDALTTIASRTKGPLSEEFLLVAARTRVSGNWKKEMEDMANRNGVEPLSDLVSDVLISFEKGTSVVNVLKDDANQMRALKNAKIMEKAKKMSTTLLIPMGIFSFVPMLVIIVGPMLIQIVGNM